MADEKTVKVDLKRSYRKNGTMYGPGKGVEMPESLANALGVLAPAAKAEKAAPKGAK